MHLSILLLYGSNSIVWIVKILIFAELVKVTTNCFYSSLPTAFIPQIVSDKYTVLLLEHVEHTVVQAQN